MVLLIPAGMIKRLIHERQLTRDDVVNEIGDKWGKMQMLTGPVLVLPYFEIKKKNHEVYKTKRQLYILPESLEINGKIDPEIRYRGIYKVIVYGAILDISGKFQVPDLIRIGIVPENIEWKNAFVVFGLNDMRGIQNELNIEWQGKRIPVNPGIENKTIARSGFNAKVPVSENSNSIEYKLNLDINGSYGLYFTPVGKKTVVKLNSNWATPSFSGSFIPDDREISKNGFEAHWTVLHLNRNYPQHWIDDAFNLSGTTVAPIYQRGWGQTDQISNLPGSTFGVNLLFPVDEYQKTMRSAKYAIMFIGLTFLIYLFVEMINKKRIHPVQYLLVSLALLLFYTLLLSLSEQIGFNLAYLISALGIIGLITAYSQSILKSIKLTVITSMLLIILYTFLFVILQMEDYSLLLGSIGLFIILGIVMYFSKKVNWYGSINEETPKQ